MAYFFVNQFAKDGDKTTVPTTGGSSGSMSYLYGFTNNYQLNQDTDPSALPVPRSQTNQLYYQITDAIRQYQTHGAPDWITSSDNLGTPFAYDIFARVRYDAGGGVQVYENLVQGNTVAPGVDSTWAIISGGASGVPIGTSIDFRGYVVPAGYLKEDGSAVSRSIYASLASVITINQTGTTTNTSTSITGLSDTAGMYVGMHVEGAGVPSGATVATIVNSTSITISAAATASASVSLRFYLWGNGDGSTTFNLPDDRRRSTIGSGGAASTDPLGAGNKTGQTGGEESHAQTAGEVGVHTHNVLGVQLVENPAFTQIQGGTDWQENGAVTTQGNTGGTPFNIYHPVSVVTRCIRYL